MRRLAGVCNQQTKWDDLATDTHFTHHPAMRSVAAAPALDKHDARVSAHDVIVVAKEAALERFPHKMPDAETRSLET